MRMVGGESVTVAVRILGGEITGDHAEVRSGLLKGNARPQSADETQHAGSPLGGERGISGGVVGVIAQRGPQLRRGILNREFESRRHYTDDDIALVIQADGSPNDCGVGTEDGSPQRMAQHNDVGPWLFVVQKNAAT